jgi:hypothetical protein
MNNKWSEKRCSAFNRQQIKPPSFYSTFFRSDEFYRLKKRAAKPFGLLRKLVTFIAFLNQSSQQATLSCFTASRHFAKAPFCSAVNQSTACNNFARLRVAAGYG